MTSSNRLLRLPQVLEMVPLAKASIYRRIAEGAFPAPVKSGRTSMWRECEVDEWCNALTEGASPPDPPRSTSRQAPKAEAKRVRSNRDIV